MSWKNLHFRPPILKKRILDGVSTDPVLIRDMNGSAVPFVGYIMLRNSDNSFYHVCGRGVMEHQAVDNLVEWTEVPE